MVVAGVLRAVCVARLVCIQNHVCAQRTNMTHCRNEDGRKAFFCLVVFWIVPSTWLVRASILKHDHACIIFR